MSKFAKRHYEVIAQAMQDAYPKDGAIDVLAWHSAVVSLSEAFARDNGQFKRDRFIWACQPGANVRARKLPANV